MKNLNFLLLAMLLFVPNNLMAAETAGFLTANGQKAGLKYAIAYETDSISDPGFLDVVIVISDRKISESVARNQEKLEEMARNKELVALRVVLNPDAKVMSAEPYIRPSKLFSARPCGLNGNRPLLTKNRWQAGFIPRECKKNLARNGNTM